MSLKRIGQVIGESLDPRRSIDHEIPRAFLFAKNGVEYLFKIAGFFLLLCISTALGVAACSDNLLLILGPAFLTWAFFFYIALTTLGIPIFLAIGTVENNFLWRVLAYATVLVMFVATSYSLSASPLMLVLESYVMEVFPSARACIEGLE